MQTPEQFAQQQARELAIFNRRQEIAVAFTAAGLPIPDYIADGTTYGARHVCYWNRDNPGRSMGDAIELFSRFHIIPAAVLKNGSTMLHPESRMTEKMRNYKRDAMRSADFAVCLKVEYSHDRHYTSAELEFFAEVGEEFVYVSIKFGRDYIGQCHALKPDVIESRGYGNILKKREFRPHAVLNGARDSWLSYGTGETGQIKNSADHRFLFVSDFGDDIGPADTHASHAIEQLQIIAADLKA